MIVPAVGLVIPTTGAVPEPVVAFVVSVAVTVAAVYPVALAVKVVVPVLLESAVTVTVCGVA